MLRRPRVAQSRTKSVFGMMSGMRRRGGLRETDGGLEAIDKAGASAPETCGAGDREYLS